jgi:hypothetical protein
MSLTWSEQDNLMLKQMGIAAVTLDSPRLARLRHADGSESRHQCNSQDEAVQWIRQRIRLGDDLVIEDAEQQ